MFFTFVFHSKNSKITQTIFDIYISFKAPSATDLILHLFCRWARLNQLTNNWDRVVFTCWCGGHLHVLNPVYPYPFFLDFCHVTHCNSVSTGLKYKKWQSQMHDSTRYILIISAAVHQLLTRFLLWNLTKLDQLQHSFKSLLNFWKLSGSYWFHRWWQTSRTTTGYYPSWEAV